jgi:hypothetical protein
MDRSALLYPENLQKPLGFLAFQWFRLRNGLHSFRRHRQAVELSYAVRYVMDELKGEADASLRSEILAMCGEGENVDKVRLMAIIATAMDRTLSISITDRHLTYLAGSLRETFSAAPADTAEERGLLAGALAIVNFVKSGSALVVHKHETNADAMHSFLLPLYRWLELPVTVLYRTTPLQNRSELYRTGIVHIGASELILDYLRDYRVRGRRSPGDLSLRIRKLRNRGLQDRLLLPGLRSAIIVDGQDVLYESAVTPIVATERRECESREIELHAIAGLAAQLEPETDFVFEADTVILTAEGKQRLLLLSKTLPGELAFQVDLDQQVTTALMAFHMLKMPDDYQCEEGQISLGDAISKTARPELHDFLAIKCGLRPVQAAVATGRISFRLFFQRFCQLSVLVNSQFAGYPELQRVHRIIPLSETTLPAIPIPARVLADGEEKIQQVVEWCHNQAQTGRYALVETTDKQEAERVSAKLKQENLRFKLLDDRLLLSPEALSTSVGYPLLLVTTQTTERERVLSILAENRQCLSLQMDGVQTWQIQYEWYASLEDPLFLQGLKTWEQKLLLRSCSTTSLPAGWTKQWFVKKAFKRWEKHKNQTRAALISLEEHYRKMLVFTGTQE